MKNSHRTHLRKRIKSILLLALFLSTVFVQPVQAQTTLEKQEHDVDYDFYASNGIIWYDPNATCGVTPDANTGTVVIVGGDNPEKVWNFLRAKGLTSEQAAGVMGNIQAESGFNPGIVEGGSGIGFGIAQWSFGRRTALEAAAREKSVDVADLGFQLEYLYQELNVRTADRPEYRQYGTEWKAVSAQTTIDDALVAFHHEFEISHLMDTPDPRAAVIAARGGFAHNWFDKFSGNAPGEGGGSNPGEPCAQAPTGNLNKALLEYAWPTYRGNDITPTAAPQYPNGGWKRVIDTYPGKGRYIGGTEHPGIDCGGFTTNLVIDSGFDVTFNYGGVIKDGAGNTIAQKTWAESNWQNLSTTTFAQGGTDPAKLLPGDVAINGSTPQNSTHTFIFVGEEAKQAGFGSTVASASWDTRAPMADTAQNPADPSFTWYRKK
jgi:hypothetical protein